MIRLLNLVPLFLVSVLIIFMFWKIKNIDETKELNSALINKKFPNLNLEKLEGIISLNDILGEKFFIVNFFASWCVPCRVEHEALGSIGEKHIVIGVAYKDSESNIKNFISELGNPYNAIVLDNDGTAGIELGLYGVPETYFIGKDGKIKYRHVGPITKDKFDKIILLLKNSI